MSLFSVAQFFRKPPVSTGAEMTPRGLLADACGAITSMAKRVNDLLNDDNQFTATKASIMIAGSVPPASFPRMTFPQSWRARIPGRKIGILRGAILCFLSGVLMAIPHHLKQS